MKDSLWRAGLERENFVIKIACSIIQGLFRLDAQRALSFSCLFYRRIAQECTFSHGSNASHKPRKRYNKNKRAGATIEFRYGLRLRITP